MSKHGRALSAPPASCGVDVSKDWLDGSLQSLDGRVLTTRVANSSAGHRQLCKWLRKGARRGPVRVTVEATGTYSLDVALALQAAGYEVMVVNPRAAHDFARALLQRTHTDQTAADSLREFAARMPFLPWQPPPVEVRQLQAIARRIAALTAQRAAEKNRWHAVTASQSAVAIVRKDLELNIRQLTRRIATLLEHARTLIAGHAVLSRRYEQVRSIPGIGPASAVQLLGELLVLAPDMTAKQWVAHAGLNPLEQRSGSSLWRRPRLSKQGNARLRAGLYMPALVARRRQAAIRAFGDQLAARGKTPLQVIVAVMRKLLHTIHGMFASDTLFEPEKFYRVEREAA